MHDEQEQPPSSPLSCASGRSGLRELFAAELAERLPRLQAAVHSGDEVQLQHARRDAHSLAGSAVVVGELAASRTARAAEALLAARPDGGAVPAGLAARVDELTARLAGWCP